MAIGDYPTELVRHNSGCPVPRGLDGFCLTIKMQNSVAVWSPVFMHKCTLIGHVGFQPLTTDFRSNPTPEGFEPLTKSSRSNFPTNCTLWHPLKHVFKNNFKSNFKNNFKSMTWNDMEPAFSELTQWSGSLTCRASDLGQARQKFYAAYVTCPHE